MRITIADSNDNRPVFSIPLGGYMATLLENATIGEEVITVRATDIDQGDNQNITYAISGNDSITAIPFSIPDPTVRTS